MTLQQWDQMRTALYVQKTGSVSAAANALGIHRATVMRHIESVETMVGVKLFLRGPQGYRATDAGLRALGVAHQVETLVNEFYRAADRPHTGISRIIFSALPPITTLMLPAVAEFIRNYQNVAISLQSSTELMKLELGQAHVALRAGPKPVQLDYVAQHFCDIHFSFYASQGYIAQNGAPRSVDEFSSHTFVLPNLPQRLPFQEWLRRKVPADRVFVEANGPEVAESVIRQGIAIGVLADFQAQTSEQLVKIFSLPKSVSDTLWLVTHGDIHHQPEIKAFTAALKRQRTDAAQIRA